MSVIQPFFSAPTIYLNFVLYECLLLIPSSVCDTTSLRGSNKDKFGKKYHASAEENLREVFENRFFISLRRALGPMGG